MEMISSPEMIKAGLMLRRVGQGEGSSPRAAGWVGGAVPPISSFVTYNKNTLHCYKKSFPPHLLDKYSHGDPHSRGGFKRARCIFAWEMTPPPHLPCKYSCATAVISNARCIFAAEMRWGGGGEYLLGDDIISGDDQGRVDLEGLRVHACTRISTLP